jgi:hypothetical protein
LQVDQARRLKELEFENAKLKRIVANLSLEKLVLKDIAEGRGEACGVADLAIGVVGVHNCVFRVGNVGIIAGEPNRKNRTWLCDPV